MLRKRFFSLLLVLFLLLPSVSAFGVWDLKLPVSTKVDTTIVAEPTTLENDSTSSKDDSFKKVASDALDQIDQMQLTLNVQGELLGYYKKSYIEHQIVICVLSSCLAGVIVFFYSD